MSESVSRLDHVVRFERLDAEMGLIGNRIGVVFSNLHHVNGTDHESYRHYCDQAPVEFVEKKCAKELALFGYEF